MSPNKMTIINQWRRSDMDKIQGRFGFITYFVKQQIQRLPVEFYASSSGLMAWLDSGDTQKRLLTPVLGPMDCKEIGGFPKVMSLYEDEVKSLFVEPQFWHQCVEKKSGLLLVFQVLHHMRIHGLSSTDALDRVQQITEELRESEQQILNDIPQIYREVEGHVQFNHSDKRIFSVTK